MANTPRIRRMPPALANKIAAGEVVQRPASALKELIENAVDAGASRIDVTVKASGRSLIQVRDNGCGMGPEDAQECFSRHATSKIESIDDLEAIQTLGFRGEALASIASVAQVTLQTSRQGDEHGTQVQISGGESPHTTPCAAPQGTSISVNNLFFNVPARRNFLKAPATELRHITDTFVSQSLAHPWTAFSLRHDGSELYRLNRSRSDAFLEALRERIGAIMGATTARAMIQVDEPTSYLSVTGYLGRPENAKRTRRNQYLFVNGRPVTNHNLRHAVRSAYDTLVPDGRHAAYTLFLSVDPARVDVNIHPLKAEVRFDDDRGAYQFLQSVARYALGSHDLVPQYSGEYRHAKVSGSGAPLWAPPERDDHASGTRQTSIVYEPERSPTPEGAQHQPEALIWQLHDRFILTQLRGGLMIVDQCAAHERILYEVALRNLNSGVGLSQQLLFPVLLNLDPADCALVRQLERELAALGFGLKVEGSRHVHVSGVPSDVRVGAEKDILTNVLEQYKANERDLKLEARDNLARSVAARGAIRPGVSLGEDEMRTLIDQLFQCKYPQVSPRGSPTVIRVTLEELQSRFSGRPATHAAHA